MIKYTSRKKVKNKKKYSQKFNEKHKIAFMSEKEKGEATCFNMN